MIGWKDVIKKAEPTKAIRWFSHGDIPWLKSYLERTGPCKRICADCGELLNAHGLMPIAKKSEVFEGKSVVCPGDWIVQDGEFFLVVTDKEMGEKYEEYLG